MTKMRMSLSIVVVLFAGVVAIMTFLFCVNNDKGGQVKYQKAIKLYSTGQYDEAIHIFESSAKNNDGDALFALGMIYMDDSYPKRDIAKGIHYLQQAAKLDNLFAYNNLYYYNYHDIFQESDEATTHYLQEAARLGGYKANLILASLYGEADNYINQNNHADYQRAQQHIFAAIKIKQTVETDFILGMIYAFDEKSDEHFEKGVSLLHESYNSKFAMAGIALNELANQGKINDFNIKNEYSMEDFATVMYAIRQLKSPDLLPIYSLLSEKALNALIKELEQKSTEQDSTAPIALYDIYHSDYNSYSITDKNQSKAFLKNTAKYSDAVKYQLFVKSCNTEQKEYLLLLQQAAKNGYVPAIIAYYDQMTTIYSSILDQEDEHQSLKQLNSATDEEYQLLKQLYIAANDNNQDAILALAKIYQNGSYSFNLFRDKNKSLSFYQKALNNDPYNEVANSAMIDYYLNDVEDYQKALPYVQNYAKAKPNDSKAQYDLGFIYFKLKEMDKAITHLTASLSGDITSRFEIYQMLGFAYVDSSLGENKNYAKAVQYFELALQNKDFSSYGDVYEEYEILNDIDYEGYAILGDIYYEGLGAVNVDKEKAFLYYKKITIDLNKERFVKSYVRYIETALEKNEIDETLFEYLNYLTKYNNVVDEKSILIKYEQSHPEARAYLFKFYHRTQDPELFAFIQNKARNGDLDYRYYSAVIEFEKNQNKKPLETLAQENNETALEYLYDNDSELKEKWLEQLANVTGKDKFIYMLIDYLSNRNRSDEVLAWYEKMSDKDYSFVKFRVEEAKREFDKIKEVNERIKNNEPDAFFDMYKKLGRENWKTSEFYLKKAADLGMVEAQIAYADILAKSDNVKDKSLSLVYYEKAASQNNHDALIALGKMYLVGNIVYFDKNKAREYFIKADKISSNYMGSHYLNWMNRVENLDKKVTSEGENALAIDQYNLSVDYQKGEYIPQDLVKYRHLIKQAADSGLHNAQVRIAQDYILGRSGFSVDVETGIAYLQKANSTDHWLMKYYEQYYLPAQNKADFDAQFKLGHYYLNNSNFDEPFFRELGKSLVVDAANHNSGIAQLYLYETSPIASSESKIWFDKALKNRSPQVTTALAALYDKGKLNEITNDEAKNILQMAAKLDKKYYYNLARLYQYQYKDDQQALEALRAYQELDKTLALKLMAKIYADSKSKCYQLEKAIAIYEALYQAGDLSIGNQLAKALYNIDINESLKWKVKTLNDYLELSYRSDDSNFNYDGSFFYNLDAFYKQIGNDYYQLATSIQKGKYIGANYDPSTLYLMAFKLNNRVASATLFNYYFTNFDLDNSYIFGVLSDSQMLGFIEKQIDSEKLSELNQAIGKLKIEQKEMTVLAKLNRLKKRAKEYGGNASIEYADVLLKGEITDKDVPQAIVVLEEAGLKGYAFAYNRLGNIYKSGLNDEPIDITKAIYYFDLGAKLNDSNCAHQVGDIYYFGMEGAPKDYIKAMDYFAKTDIDQGAHHALAKYKMAYMYYNGLGTDKDIKKAYELLKIGEKYGNENSTKALAEWDFSKMN